MTPTTHHREAPLTAQAAAVRAQVTVPLRFADGYATTAEVFTFTGLADGKEHLLLALGDWQGATVRAALGGQAPLVRPHSECLTGDVFGSERCDCGPQLREAVERIAEQGGFLLYLRQEGRGIGLYAKLDAYALQNAGLDTYEANVALGRGEDERDYTAAAQMLKAVGASRIRLLSNNPDKALQLSALGIAVEASVATGVHATASNLRYLAAKRDHTAHTLHLPEQHTVVAYRADVATDSPSRYAERLISYLGSNILFETSSDGVTATATLAAARGRVVVGDGVLTLLVEAPDEDAAATFQHLLGSSLERFGQRAGLHVRWHRGHGDAAA